MLLYHNTHKNTAFCTVEALMHLSYTVVQIVRLIIYLIEHLLFMVAHLRLHILSVYMFCRNSTCQLWQVSLLLEEVTYFEAWQKTVKI